MKNLSVLPVGLVLALSLSACDIGDSDSDDIIGAPGFTDQVRTIANASSETAEPLSVDNFNPATSETAEPVDF